MPSNFLDDFEHCDPTNVEKQDRKLDGLHLFSLLSHSTWHHHNGNSIYYIVTEIEWMGKLEDAEMRMQYI